jgi:hypothetical protein
MRDVYSGYRILDPGFRIPFIFIPYPDPDLGSRSQKSTGYRIPDLDPQHWKTVKQTAAEFCVIWQV